MSDLDNFRSEFLPRQAEAEEAMVLGLGPSAQCRTNYPRSEA